MTGVDPVAFRAQKQGSVKDIPVYQAVNIIFACYLVASRPPPVFGVYGIAKSYVFKIVGNSAIY